MIRLNDGGLMVLIIFKAWTETENSSYQNTIPKAD